MLCVVAFSVLCLENSCAEGSQGLLDAATVDSDSGDSKTTGSVDSGGSSDSGSPDVDSGTAAPAGSNCGNGELTKDEACDDGNTEDGDGCLANCRGVEQGYSCPIPGNPCHRIARCGDGVSVLPELCDDGNKTGGDGCSERCKIELGFKCEGNPSVCSPTTCGDGVVEGAESCDDGNAMPFDGCSADCLNEPDCSSESCRSECGDGIVLNETCDDGNTVDGDGCSSDCAPEPGFECQQPELGDTMVVPIVLRDFRYGTPHDFEPGATGRSEAVTGMVESELDEDGKPVYSGIDNSLVESEQSFASWYRDVDGVNSTTASKLTLWNNGEGAYVNRYGADGEQFQKTKTAYYCGNVGAELTDDAGTPIPCTSMHASETDCTKAEDQGLEILECYEENGTYKATILTDTIDGNPVFFPLDDETFTPLSERSYAQLPAPLYSDNWDIEEGEPQHNFSFTSEVRYWFEYTTDKTYTLAFTGDDDVWVFINSRLAVDLGGIHTPVSGSITLDANSADDFGLQDGEVYEIAVFQAERQTTASSYKLTLSGFNPAPSDCRPVCGDGIVALGEECDDGINPGGYGQCQPDCTLGEYCGDGIQQENEDCDDGLNIGDPCPSGCRILIIY